MSKKSVRRRGHTVTSTPKTATAAAGINTIADAAVIGVLFTVLAFQEIRFEGYETEKAALLVLFAGVILAVRVVCLFTEGDAITRLRLSLQHPVNLGVGLLLVAAALSVPFSLSAERSLWGSPDRAQGWLAMCVYGLVFIQAAHSGRRMLPMLLPVLVTLAVPLCGFAFIARFGLDVSRPGSTTGNGNYLSAWLVLAVLVIATYLAIYARRWRWTPVQRVVTGLLSVVVLMMLATVALAGSRGALVALAFGLLTLAFLGAAWARNRRVMAVVAGVVVVAGGAYGAISSSIDTSNLSALSSTQRLFVPYDRFRLVAWEGAAGVLANTDDPLVTAAGAPDAYVGLRRVIGYGPDTVAQLQSRFELASSERTYANSFHNHIFDTLVMIGYPGLLAWVLIYGGAVFIALRALGLLPPGRWPLWVLVEICGSAAGGLLLTLVFDDVSRGAMVPLGAALGAVGGLLIWLVLMAYRDETGQVLTDWHVLVGALLAVMVVRWVDNQFGFVQAASEPLWWLLLGLLVAISREMPDIAATPDADVIPAPPAHYWQIAGMCSALMLTLGFGSGLDSAFIVQSLAVTEGYVLALLALGVGTLGALLTGKVAMRWLVIGLLAWGGVLLLKALVNMAAGDAFDAVLKDTTQTRISAEFLLLGLKGICVCGLVIVVWAWQGPAGASGLRVASMVMIVALFGIGAGYYMLNHAGGVLHNLANSVSSTEDAAFIQVADVPYAQAIDYLQSEGRARLDRAYNLLKYPQPALNRVNAQLDALFATNPFYIHTLEWGIFADAYSRVSGGNLPFP